MLDRQRRSRSSIACRSRHTTSPTSRITRANQVSVTSWTVAPTYTCFVASRENLLESVDQPSIECEVPPCLAAR
jgi:hypothetical protein